MTREALEQNQVPIYFVAVIVAAIGGLLAPNTAQGLSVLVTPTIGKRTPNSPCATQAGAH